MTATDPTAAAIHARILAEPGEDAHRLVYADWLEENGDPARAQFIRVQVEISRREKPVSDEPTSRGRLLRYDHGGDYEELRRRERSLWVRVRNEMLSGVVPGINSLGIEDYHPASVGRLRCGVVSRGFVSEVRCPLADWLDHGPAVVRAHPVETVGITDMAPDATPDERTETTSYRWLAFGGPYPQVSRDNRRIPEWAAKHLPGFQYHTPHPTPASAMAELSAVFLAWAKSAPVRSA